MFSRILLGQVLLTGNTFRFSNEILLTGKFAQARTCSQNKSKSTSEKVTTKEKKKHHRAERSTADRLKASYPKKDVRRRKVAVVGSGQAAVASTLALLATETTQEVCMLGVDSGFRIQGEAADIRHASVFLHDPKIVATKDHADSKGSEICVIATGTEQGANEDNYEFTTRNSRLIHDIIPELMRYSPDAVYLIASDPVDVLTREAWIAGGMHQSRILGTGTNLYSAMLRTLISGRFGVHAASCHGLVLGHHNSCSNPCANSGGDGGHGLCRAASRVGVRPSSWNRTQPLGRFYCKDSKAATATAEKLFLNLSSRQNDTNRKVTVVGAGAVGMAVVFGILAKRITNHISLVDMRAEKLKAEFLDLMHGSIFLKDPIIDASTDYEITAGSSICVITAGTRPKGLEKSRLACPSCKPVLKSDHTNTDEIQQRILMELLT